ncbi:MAG: SDR family oxidoreductase, partial [Opitutales bacterium]|nr:SDR family oxidoreductase [Opitutales bacterium]
GKTALITGSYRGLGLSIATGLAEAGARVLINGRSNEGVDSAVVDLRKQGFEAEGFAFDITDVEAVDASLARIQMEIGAIDVLVNNAGIHKRNPILDMSVEDFKEVLDVNLTSAFIMSKAVAVEMIERGRGKIINVCSLMSHLARPTIANYSAAKGGLHMLTKSMTGEWAAKNIQINGIGPGYFETDLTRPLKKNPEFDGWICGRTPAGRWGQPDELKGVAVFLASDASTFVNGQLIMVDGGLMAVV